MPANLKKFREALGLSQIDFAKTLDLNKTTYNNYEAGIRDPKSDFWEKVARTYGVTIDYLLGLTDDPKPKVAILLAASEQEHIKKYRALDPYGKDTVNFILDREYTRTQQGQENDLAKIKDQAIRDSPRMRPTVTEEKLAPQEESELDKTLKGLLRTLSPEDFEGVVDMIVRLRAIKQSVSSPQQSKDL